MKEYVPGEAAQKILDILANASEPMSLAQLNAASDGIVFKTGHVSALSKNGKITSTVVETVCPSCGAKRKFNVYSLVR